MRVGIIGGGVSGLAAARHFLQCGIACTVFDTGKRGVGGRCSSRTNTDFPGAVDHAAQFVKSSGKSDSFTAFVDECAAAGVLRPWDGKFVGSEKEGLGALPNFLAEGIDVRQDRWVAPNGGVFQRGDGTWSADKEQFDAIIIAHNGKCAERLTSKVRSPIAKLCKASFGTKPATGRMTLNSVYSLVCEVPAGAFASGETARVFDDDSVLAFAANQGKKLGWASEDDATETWTALSTGAFGKKNKHPQEQLRGTDVEERVKTEMLAALGAALGASEPVKPLRWRLQLWGAALPLNAHVSDVPFAWDADNKIGVVGDWLAVEGGPVACVEAAFCSGDTLAKHLAASPSASAGLEGSYAVSETAFSRRPPRAEVVPASSKRSDAEKQSKKLRKALKRIGELRRMDYLTLTTDQRVKISGEADVLEKLKGLGVADVEALRRKLQPGLETPMPRSKSYTRERDEAREEDKKVREWEERTIAKGQVPRAGDWDCALCGNVNWAKRAQCNKCGAEKSVAV